MKNTNEWIKWTSSSITPVPPETLVQVVFVEGGPCRTLPAGDLYWWHDTEFIMVEWWDKKFLEDLKEWFNNYHVGDGDEQKR